MKIKHLLIGMLAVAASVACKQDEPVEEPSLEVNKTAVALAATAGEATFNVTANNAWSAEADADWVSLDPASGAGAEKAVTVKVTAEDNTAEARTATVTVKSGKLTKTVKVTQAAAEGGEEPGPGDEPTPGEVSWGMMGCFVDNLWSTDVPMTKEGEWIVAKGAQFTELTFKIRGNGSWDDATNIGRAPGSERAVVNGKIEVVTAEYSKANLGGDAADIKLNGEAGTYDVYFSFENLEVYVMEEGFKPGEKEPQNPDPVEITYTVVGTLADAAWVNNAPAGLMAKEGDLYVAKNVPFVWNSTCYGGNYNIIEFKILETGTWDGFAYPESNVNQYANAEITVQVGGENIAVNAPEGSYDVYFDKANLKVWVMEAGFKPGEKEPLIPEEVEPVTEGDIWVNDGTVGAAAWSGSPYRFAKEGMDGQNECVAEIPAAVWEGMKIAPFCVNVKPATAETEWWQIRVLDGWWTKNDESGDSDINPQSAGLVNNGDGTYTFQVDLTTNPDLVALIDAQHLLFAGDGFIINKMYFGDLPTPGEPEQPELQKSDWALVGSFNGWDAAGSTAFLSVLDTDYFVYYAFEAGANTEFKFVKDGKWADQGGAEVGGAIGTAEPNTIQTAGGKNIVIAEAGKYDIYLASDLSKFYVMTEGKLPAEATEPAPVEATYTVVGTLNGINWSNNAPEGLMTKDGAYYVAKNVPFVTAKTLYDGPDQFEFKVVETGTWNGYGAPAGMAAASANTEITLKEGGDNIPVKAAEGNYDVYFDKANAKVWVMTPGLKPGETPVQPEPDPTPEPEPEPEPNPNPNVLVAEVVMADYGWPNKYDYIDNEKFWINSDIAFRFRIGSSSTAPLYDAGDCSVHMFQKGSTLDVMSNEHTEYVETKFRITSIEITFASNQCTLTPDSGELSAEGEVRTWTGDATNVKFTASGTDKNHRAYVKAIKVYYEAL